MRQLASIQRIDDIQPIPNADAIEVCRVQGWHVVIKKGEFQVGDKCIYFEYDSVLPPKPEYEFLAKSKYRIKTIKLRGQISQGLCLPILDHMVDYEIGTDVTEEMGVVKYDPPEVNEGGFIGGRRKGNFPILVPKTDETRIQSCPKFLEEFKGITFYWTVKLDGTSGTFCKIDNEISVCSRNRSLVEDDASVYWKMYRENNLESVFENYDNLAIQGEICGPGIQGNKLNLPYPQLFVFNVFDIAKQEYYDYFDFVEFCEKHKLKTVPIIGTSVLNMGMAEILEFARGKYPSGKHREGVVGRPVDEMKSMVLRGQRASIKVINNDFLLKEK